MKNNRKRKVWLCAFAMMGVSVLITPVSPAYAEETSVLENLDVEESGIETRTPKIDWVYKVINGHLYKRLYNYSTGRWESDWILIE